MKFSELNIGEKFTYMNERFKKIKDKNLGSPFGIMNCQSLDTGICLKISLEVKVKKLKEINMDDKETFWVNQKYRDEMERVGRELKHERLPPEKRFNRDPYYRAVVHSLMKLIETGYTREEILGALKLAGEIITHKQEDEE